MLNHQSLPDCQKLKMSKQRKQRQRQKKKAVRLLGNLLPKKSASSKMFVSTLAVAVQPSEVPQGKLSDCFNVYRSYHVHITRHQCRKQAELECSRRSRCGPGYNQNGEVGCGGRQAVALNRITHRLNDKPPLFIYHLLCIFCFVFTFYFALEIAKLVLLNT